MRMIITPIDHNVDEDCDYDDDATQGCQEEAPFIFCTSKPTEYISDLAQVNQQSFI